MNVLPVTYASAVFWKELVFVETRVGAESKTSHLKAVVASQRTKKVLVVMVAMVVAFMVAACSPQANDNGVTPAADSGVTPAPDAGVKPDEKTPINIDNVQNSIAVFEATLITPNAPFDKYLKGDANALSDEEKNGLAAFINKGCASCHNGINIGGDQYRPFGVIEKPGADFLPPADKGRFEVTKSASDEYVYKVPSLRNVALTPPYFHSGKSWDLKQAVAVMSSSQLGTVLTAEEVNSITAFLHSLTGEQPKVVYPILPPSVATTPRPQLGIRK